MGAEGAPTAPRPTRHATLSKQLRNTKMCVHFQQGVCKYGAKCLFAHEQGSVAPLPDLKNTRFCVKFEAGNCDVENCPFAHTQDELRATDFFYKTTMCMWHEAGKCRNGDQCRFAHGDGDLRKVASSKKAGSANGSSKQTGDQPAKQTAKAAELPAKQVTKARSSTDKEMKESNKRRTKQTNKQQAQEAGKTVAEAKENPSKSKPPPPPPPKDSKQSLQPKTMTPFQSSGLHDPAMSGQTQPMFIQPDAKFMQQSMPSFMSSAASLPMPSAAPLPEYHQMPSLDTVSGLGLGLDTWMGLGLPQPQAEAPFSQYAAPYPGAANLGLSADGPQDIATLSASIKSLSGQLKQIQKYIQKSVGNEVNGAGQSDSTQSGTNDSYSQSQSSGDSSPPSTPPLQHDSIPLCELERLNWQLHMAAMARGMVLHPSVGRPFVQGQPHVQSQPQANGTLNRML